MKFVYSQKYEMDFGTHVFPTQKYRMVKERLLALGWAKEEDFIEPPPPNIDDIRLVHTKEYIDDMLNLRWTRRTMRSELPLTWQIIEGYLIAASGTILASELALQEGSCVHIGGGFHHAFPDHGEGFCYINDIAVAIKKLLVQNKIERAAVIDCDLHQGNGTAKIFQNDDRVFTFSIHQEHLYPIKEESDLDIGLDDFAGDATYLHHLRSAVPKILTTHKPQFVIYVAGADPYKDDQLGTLQLTKAGLEERDRIVVENCQKEKIPFAVVFAGGYALKIEDTVDIHLNTCKVCLGIKEPVITTEEKKSDSTKSQPND
ncbi:MAG: histone deacetylase [candidate division WOR-3 bacterium]